MAARSDRGTHLGLQLGRTFDAVIVIHAGNGNETTVYKR